VSVISYYAGTVNMIVTPGHEHFQNLLILFITWYGVKTK